MDFITTLSHNGLQYIGLMLLCALSVFAIFRFLRGPGRLAMHGLLKSKDARIQIVESLTFHGPSQRTLMLVKRDGVEHLVMIGGPNDLVVEQTIIRGIPMGTVPGLSHSMATARVETPETAPDAATETAAPVDGRPSEPQALEPSFAAPPGAVAASSPVHDPIDDLALPDHDPRDLVLDDDFPPPRAEPRPEPAPLPPVSADPPRRAATFDPLSRPRTTPLPPQSRPNAPPPANPAPASPPPASPPPASPAPALAAETPPAFHFALDHDEITSRLEEALRLDFHADFEEDAPSVAIPAEASPPPRAGHAGVAAPAQSSSLANSLASSPATGWLRNRRPAVDDQAPRPATAHSSTLGRGPRELQADRERFDTLIAQMTRQQAGGQAGGHAPEIPGEPQPPPIDPPPLDPLAHPAGPSHPAGGIDDAVDAEMAQLLGELNGKPPPGHPR